MSGRMYIDWQGLVPLGAKTVKEIPKENWPAIMALPSLRVKFEGMYARGEDDQCWEWRRSGNHLGYGHFCIGKVRVVATRVSWWLYRGPIPDGMDLCHRCDNPRCVNPSHLFLGTAKDNSVDMAAKGRAVMPDTVGEANCAAKLTEQDVIAIRLSSETNAQLAKRYGLAATSISDARCGYTWGHISDPPPWKKRHKGNPWTEAEMALVREKAGKIAPRALAELSGRGLQALYQVASKNGISLRVNAA